MWHSVRVGFWGRRYWTKRKFYYSIPSPKLHLTHLYFGKWHLIPEKTGPSLSVYELNPSSEARLRSTALAGLWLAHFPAHMLYATYMGSNWSARKESLKCIRCFSPLEFIGMTPGSTITTTPTIRWCSSNTTLVTSGTRSKASCSDPQSSATTTSRFVQVNTALQRGKKRVKG